MKKIIIVAAAFTAFISTQSSNLVGSDREDIAYPTTIKPLEASQLETTQLFIT